MMFDSTRTASDYLIKNKYHGLDRSDALLYVMADSSELARVMRNDCLTPAEMLKAKWKLMRTSGGCFQLLKWFKHLLQEGEEEIIYEIMCEDPGTVYSYYLQNKRDIPLLERRRLLDIILISGFHSRHLLIMKEALEEDMNYILTVCKHNQKIMDDFLTRSYMRQMDEKLCTYRFKALQSLLKDSKLCLELVKDKKVNDVEKFSIHEANWKTYFEENRRSFRKMYEYAKLFDGYLNLEEERHLILKVMRPEKEDQLWDIKRMKISNEAKELIESYFVAKKLASSQKTFE